jgi:hypothetical protein
VDRLQIERIGGLAGFGGPRLKSKGDVALADVAPDVKAAVDKLFSDPRFRSEAAVLSAPRTESHPFFYRITREATTITVPESEVPSALKDSVKDVLE